MNPESIDWQALERLRAGFLAGTAGLEDYWSSEAALASYDATFAQRIGWKWDFVLSDLRQRGWTPPTGELLDWGCGTGVAARAFADCFHGPELTGVGFVDRSPAAVRFAARRMSERFPKVPIRTGLPPEASVATAVVSHVLTELQPVQVDALLAVLRPATAILWVEPGTYESSLALIAIRERLRQDFHPVAPCLHALACGVLAPGNERHWCHHFAEPPPGVFMDPFWGRFAHLLDIDLRSVPLSYLVLDRRPPPAAPAGSVRILGRARVHKADFQVLTCDASGVREQSRSRRDFPESWRAAKKDRLGSIQVWGAPRPRD